VLVSPRGGAAEVVDELAGAIAVQPDTDGIVGAVEALVAPELWREAVLRVEAPAGNLEDWLAAHERVYAAALERA
jgi:hypothetical protein